LCNSFRANEWTDCTITLSNSPTKSQELKKHFSLVCRKTIRLEPGKTKNSEGRTFPYANLPELDELIEARWQAREKLKARGVICPYVFHRHGEPILTFRKAWKAATIAAGCPGRIPHDFRRSAVRNMVRRGIPEKQAMQLTGHKTPSVFSRYDIVNEQDLRDAVGKLAGEGSGQFRDSRRSGSA
jgi:integrase